MLKFEPINRRLTRKLNRRSNILLMMSGSIACAKVSSLISEWTKRGHDVKVVCTRSVAEFIGRASLQGLGASQVFDNIFAAGEAMEHIALARWADIIVVAPATSNLINKLSAGIADDAVTTVWQAAYGKAKPMVIVPAMNTHMWQYPATRESVRRLKQWGVHVLAVAKGDLACGESGEGRMLEPAVIMQTIERLLAFDPQSGGKRILITAGGTREPIDSVRYIGNMSSGRTAAGLVDGLAVAGHRVCWLGAENAIRPERADAINHFSSFSELECQLKSILAADKYDVVIHAAAVSDFSIDSITTCNGDQGEAVHGKLSSETGLLLRLKPNPKLLGQIKSWSANPDVRVIGFKLTDSEDPLQHLTAVTKQFDNSGVDAVVHNDLSEINAMSHPFNLYTPGQRPVFCADNGELVTTINKILENVS